MSPRFPTFPLLVFLSSCLAFPVASAAQITQDRPTPKVVSIAIDSKGGQGKVADQLFGTFLEPIDNSINNGVSAEILVNGSLEGGLWSHSSLEEIFREQPELIESTNNTGIPIPWQSLNRAAGNRFELHAGDAANSWQSLEIMGVPGEATGIMQRVYLPVQRTREYWVSLYAKHLTGSTTVTVSLRSRGTGQELATATIQAEATGWKKYQATLELPQDAVRRLEPVNFAVAVEGNERVDVDQISLLPADAVEGMDPDVIQMAKAMHMSVLRFGGNFSSYYHWRDGIGPLDRRITTENIAWGIPEYNNFGTDEFLSFCRQLNVVPQFNLNMGSGTVPEAAEWVSYIRERYKGPLVLELGNELWGKWQVGYPTLQEVPGRTLEFSRAVKTLAPEATLIATGERPGGNEAWNTAMLTNPPETFDLLSTHFIVGTNHVKLRPYTPDFMAAAAYAVPFVVGERLDRMQAQLDHAGRSNKHIAVTEWLFNSKGEGERNFTNESPSSRNEGGAVMIAATFNTYFRHNEQVKLVDLTGLMEFAGIWKRKEQVFGTPAYYVFSMYSDAKGQTVLPITTDTGTYSVHQGTEGYSEATGVPYIDAVATRSQDNKMITIFCVNRSLNEDIETSIRMNGQALQELANTWQIRASSRYERNDEVEPQHVVPIPGSEHISKEGVIQLTLPHESVTKIQVRVR